MPYGMPGTFDPSLLLMSWNTSQPASIAPAAAAIKNRFMSTRRIVCLRGVLAVRFVRGELRRRLSLVIRRCHARVTACRQIKSDTSSSG